MSMKELQKQTDANISAKADLIWQIATHLVGLFKPHEYGKVILPMTVLKRFDDALRKTKPAVVEMAKKLDAQHIEGAARDGILCRISGFDFYNTSNFDFAKLVAEPDDVESNFEAYLQGFSSNVNMVKADTMFSLVKPYLGSFYKLIPAAVLTVAVGILLTLFLKTRLGLSIRATGDNPDMVRASSINTAFTVTVGLCLSNAMTALSGAVLAQYQKTADINLGTGMVIIGLASLIIGETLMPRGKTWMKALGAILGSILYRFIIAIALRLDLPSECLKLISAVIVALAIGLPAIKSAVRPATKGGKA